MYWRRRVLEACRARGWGVPDATYLLRELMWYNVVGTWPFRPPEVPFKPPAGSQANVGEVRVAVNELDYKGMLHQAHTMYAELPQRWYNYGNRGFNPHNSGSFHEVIDLRIGEVKRKLGLDSA